MDNKVFQSVPDRFAFIVKHYPARVAVTTANTSITYVQAQVRIDEIACGLVKAGISKGTRVGVFMDRSQDFALILLAILKSGAAFVPLDPSYPRERIEQMIGISQPDLIIINPALRSGLPLCENVVTVQNLTGGCEGLAELSLLPYVNRDDPAYIMFTSGSTGIPKGVVVPHRGILRLVVNPDYVNLDSNEIIPQLSATAFDASTFELWGALLNGGTLAVPPPGKLSVSELGAFLINSRATTALFSTGFFHVIIDEQPEILSGLRQVLVGGDVLSVAHVRRLASVSPGTRVVNGYGPTETTTFAVCYTAPDSDSISETMPIGHAINNTSLFIFDEQMKPVANGYEGELYIGGDGVALGYIGNDQETAARFLHNPDGAHRDRMIYKTGDLVRKDESGLMFFVGRADQQVKIRGFRIEPGEIEARLREHALVRDVVVLAKAGGINQADKTLSAFVLLNATEEKWWEILRTYLMEVLPPFMMPSEWTVLDKFPLGATGKVDRKALLADQVQTGITVKSLEELSGAEALVCNLSAEILNNAHVSPADNFMGIGGDSLAAARLASRIEKATGVRLSLSQILASENLDSISQQINNTRPETEVAPIMRSPVSRKEFPLSFGQEQLWLIYQADSTSTAYNEPCVIAMPSAVTAAAVAYAVQELTNRHAILTTTYGMKGDTAFQQINPDLKLPYIIHEDIEPAEFDRLSRLDLATPIDLEHGPIARARYAIFKDGSAKLCFVIHHIAFDGISLFNTLLPEFQQLCNGATLPETPLRYVDFAEWQRSTITPHIQESSLRYWEDKLDGWQPVALPFRAGKPGVASQLFTIPVVLASQVRDLSRREHVSVFTITATVLVALLRRYTYQDDITIGFVHSERPSGDLENVVGEFVNTLPLRIKFAAESSLNTLLHEVWSSILSAQDHEVPYETVVARVGQKLQLRSRQLIDILISYDPPKPAMDAGWSIDHLAFYKSDPKFPLSIELGDAPDGSIYGHIEHRTDFMPHEAVNRLIHHFCTLLQAMIEDTSLLVNGAVLELSPLPAAPPTVSAQIKYHSVPDMLMQAAGASPQKIALLYGARSISYAMLYQLAREKAQALRVLRIGLGKPVALFFSDPLQRCLAAWSVWVAGGAVVPLDTEYPKERIQDCLDQISAPIILTEQLLIAEFSRYECYVFNELWTDETTELELYSSEDLAYIIFTSGSTGRPKGVLISHRSASAMISAHIELLGVDKNLKWLQMAGPGFDAFLLELMHTCAHAGTLVVAERHSLLPGAELKEVIAEQEVNASFFTPSLLAYLNPADFPTLKTIFCAGDFCPPDLASRWINAGVRFVHAYGPAECTVCSTLAVIHQPRTDFLPLGNPLPGYQLYLTDPWGNLALPGTIGEIYIGGIGVGIGYLGGETREPRFIPDYFSVEERARIYRTGDLARFNEQGDLEFIGRNDSQIKIRGMRVDPGEIESAILEDPSIIAAVVLLTGEGSNKSLGAVIEFRNDPAAGWRTVLANVLRSRLPAHMVPTFFAAVAQMPVTSNGKIDRRRLPAFSDQERAMYNNSKAGAGNLTENERTILEAWREVFPGIQNDVTADFFDLGGHSLLAARLVTRLNDRLGAKMKMRTLFEHPTIAALSAWLQDSGSPSQSTADPRADAYQKMELHRPHRANGSDIMLTGASGFVGGHLLWQLLDRTNSAIYCLGRTSQSTLLHSLAGTGPIRKEWADRVHVIQGDLAAPDMLKNATGSFGAVYHCGALVNSMYPYTVTRNANVDGTLRLIEFAAREGAVFNHISTVGVFENAERNHSGMIREEEFPAGPPPIESGYNCSKWVAEILVKRAIEEGLDARIFRLGRVAWSSRNGQWNKNDFMYRILRGCLQLNAAPDWNMDFRIAPVDAIAKAVVEISNGPTAPGTYHLTGNTVLQWNPLIAELRRRQTSMQVLSHEQWWHKLKTEESILSTLAERLAPDAELTVMPEFATDHTVAVLKALGLHEPEANIASCLLED